MKKIKRWVLDRILHSRLYPHICFFANPFKIYEYYELIRGVPFKKSDVILDVGCGAGLQTNLLGRHCGRIIGIDPGVNTVRRAQSEHYLVAGRINSEFRIATIEEAAFDADTFDKIFSVCVLEHIADDRSVLRECFRTLKPGGSLHMSIDSLATVTESRALKKHSEKYAVHRYYRPETITALLEEAGFEAIEAKPILCSDLARDLFTRWIVEDRTYRYSEAYLTYRRLVRAERAHADASKGIYIIVHARKPQ